MSTLDTLIQRNKEWAKEAAAAGALVSLPDQLSKVKALIIGCADMRVDPAHVLGIESGEAVVMRNIGGRVTPSLGEQLGLLGRIGEVAERIPGGGGEFHVIVLHHTDCGITRLVGDPDLLASYFEIGREELSAKAVNDPRKAVSVDVSALRAARALPESWLLSGLVYDVATGLVEIVVPPATSR
ncbi:MAG: carbonic anhydrase [Candidatus Sulfotelmatobacter sp.]